MDFYNRINTRNISEGHPPNSPTNQPKPPSPPEAQAKLYTISENIFGLCGSSGTAEDKVELEDIYNGLLKIKKCFKDSKIKLYCLSETCAETSKLCDKMANFLMDLSKPPKLKSILVFCESIFDWLAKDNENRILIYCQDSVSMVTLMIYAYSCYYDALLYRDIRLSVAMKSFISTNIKNLEKIPVSYRRYGGYMSLYSCMNQLQSLRSSVYLYCLVLYSFPSMESHKDNCSQLFFKIYTNEPLVCCHTSKLYCLPSSVNRLVILFDKLPISLHNDSMIVCYHRHFSLGKRTKLFRLNFHTCQAISDMLTFHCQDFEDVYPACPMKMKLDLYFRETAVFGQKECEYAVETSYSDLSSIERNDSYSMLETAEQNNESESCTLENNELNFLSKEMKTLEDRNPSDTTSITIYKTVVKDHRNKINKDLSKDKNDNVINQSGRISGPIDSYHSTKLDSVRTSSSVLNGVGSNQYDYVSKNPSYGTHSGYQAPVSSSVDRELCNQQLDTLMKDLNLENLSSTTSRKYSNDNNHYKEMFSGNILQNVSTNTNVSNNREIQLMTELLEAQKEISNLRRSMNHLDLTDQPSRTFGNQLSNSNLNSTSQIKGFNKGSVSNTNIDGNHFGTSRSRNWSKNDNDSIPRSINNIKTIPRLNMANVASFNAESNNASEFHGVRQCGYSAHRENMERERMMKEKFQSMEIESSHNLHNESELVDVFEEIETINLQPIGKGIQDLAKSLPQSKTTTANSIKVDSTNHLFTNQLGSLSPVSIRKNGAINKIETTSTFRMNRDISSPLSPSIIQSPFDNITIQTVEDRIQNWYQPQITRDEAIAILRNCSPGSFLIRDSNTYSGAYGLAIKVATVPQNITMKSDDVEAEKVRHYLIELVGNQGVSFKGFPEEPVFSSLSQLVLYYSHATSVLPCLLTLPDKPPLNYDLVRPNKSITTNQSITISSPKLSTNKKSEIIATGYSVYYLGCYDVEYITGPSVINKAIERLLEYIDARRFTECQMRINPGEGIVLTDLERKLFFRRNHPFSTITYCASDPRERKIELEICKAKGIKKTKIFGIIVKAYIAGESKCFLFGELDPAHKATNIVKIINEYIEKTIEN